MAEVIDFLFFFWLLVAGGVYVIGSIYEKQLKERQKLEAKRQKRLESLSRVDDWRPTGANNNHNNSSNSNSNSNNHNYNSSSTTNTSQYNSSHLYNDRPQATTQTTHYTNPYDPNYVDRFNSNASAAASATTTNLYKQTDFGHHDVGAPANTSFSPNIGYSAREPIYQQQAATFASQANHSIPTATGFNSDCVDWVNRILFLFYSQANKYGPIIAENVYRSLNEKLSNIMSSSVEFGDLMIEFQSIDLTRSTRPELRNVRTESESDKSVSAVCKIYNQRLVCNLKLQKTRLSSMRATSYGGGVGSSGMQEDPSICYELTLENLEGKLKSVAMFNDKLIVVQFMEKPDTKILLRQLSAQRSPMNEDTLVSLILQSLTQVVVDLYFGDDLEFPQFIKQQQQQQQQQQNQGYKNKLSQLKGSANEIKRQIKHDFLGALSLGDNKERKIFVKLLRAKNINYNQNVTCILELDHPKQHAISTTKQGSNPYWDEHFLFVVSEKASNDKLTLELWDSLDANLIKVAKTQQDLAKQKNNNNNNNKRQQFNKTELTASGKFLGFARLDIDELRRNPVQRQTLQLQSRSTGSEQQDQPSSNMIGGLDLSDSIGGEIDLELMFLEHSNQSNSQLKKSASANSLSSLGGGVVVGDLGDVVSVDRKLTPSGYLITTTTITKPASKRASSRDRLSPSAGTLPRNYSPVSSTTEQSGLELSSLDGVSNQLSQQVSATGDDTESGRPDSRLSRSRSRSRGFLRAIKRRFSFSRNRRSRSVSESASPTYPRSDSLSALGGQQQRSNNNNNNNSNNMDAISIDSRSRASSEVSISAGRAKSMPASRDSNEVPTIVINKSRLSDASSAFNFAQPKSQLVIECQEPKLSGPDSNSKDRTLLRHYAIPDDPASERRWRQRGVKLHLFNEHQFVACHLAGSSTCHLCGRVFSRRPGKQGYKCRNCHLLSHKQCHVKVDHNCPYATKDGLKLEYIDADPPASLVLEKSHSSQQLHQQQHQQQQQKPNRPTSRLAMKSISVEVDDR